MYIVNEKLPKDCFECKFRTKCNVWEAFLKLPINIEELNMDDLEYLKPMVFSHCKLYEVPNKYVRLFHKWIKRECMHICLFCKHKHKCEMCILRKD